MFRKKHYNMSTFRKRIINFFAFFSDRLKMQQKIFLPICFTIVISLGVIAFTTNAVSTRIIKTSVVKQLQNSVLRITEAIGILQGCTDTRELNEKIKYRLQNQKTEFTQLDLDIDQFFLTEQGELLNAYDLEYGNLISSLDLPVLKSIVQQRNGIKYLQLEGSQYTAAFSYSPEQQFIYCLMVADKQYLKPVFRLQRLIIGMGIIALFLVFLTTLLVTKGVSKPIKRLVQLVKEMEQGNFSSPENLRGAGLELGNLINSLNLMVVKVGQVLRAVQLTTKEINNKGTALAEEANRSKSSMQQIVAATRTLVTATEEQTATNQETSKLLHQINTTINEIAKSIEQTADHSQGMKQKALDGQHSLARMIQQINYIEGTSSTAISQVKNLSINLLEINRIIEIINNVAEKIHMLGLNAAIEAARAGEQGHGFSIVADEIRQLAKNTTESTKSIIKLLNSLQTETEETVQITNEVGTLIKTGVSLSVQVDQAFQNIAKGIQDNDKNLQKVLGNSQEIKLAVANINNLLETVELNLEATDNSTRQIAAGSEDQYNLINQVSDSSVCLVDSAIQLKNLTEHFKV